jgi:glycine/D-amino acid oxidase-like deaminating enzyme
MTARCAAVGLVEYGARVGGVRLASGEVLRADGVVLACGAWTTKLVPALDPWLAVVAQPVAHLKLAQASEFSPPAFVPWAADIATSGWYGFCDDGSGVVKIANHGPGIPCDPSDARVVPEEFAPRVRAFVAASLPALADAAITRQRLCLYCDSADGDFIIDRDPGRDGLVVAAGGSGHGFKFMPLLGELIADVVEGGAAQSRFRWQREARADVVTEAARCATQGTAGD